MIHRSLDVVFQFMFRLIAILVAIPLAVGGVAIALDHAQIVSARVWADRPVFTPEFVTDRFGSYRTPAQIEAALMAEVIATDSFVGKVLMDVDPQYQGWTDSHRQQGVADLRARLSVDPQAEHLFIVNYKTNQPQLGVTVVKALLNEFAVTVQQVETSQIASAQDVLQSQLDTARKDMNTAITLAQTYQATHNLDAQSAAADPNYSALLSQARTKTDHYLAVAAQLDQARASQAAVTTIQSSIFHVVDPPALAPLRLSQFAPALKSALSALGALFAAEVLFIYVIARRDPTVRALEDVRREVGFKPLGSTPALGRR